MEFKSTKTLSQVLKENYPGCTTIGEALTKEIANRAQGKPTEVYEPPLNALWNDYRLRVGASMIGEPPKPISHPETNPRLPYKDDDTVDLGLGAFDDN